MAFLIIDYGPFVVVLGPLPAAGWSEFLTLKGNLHAASCRRGKINGLHSRGNRGWNVQSAATRISQ
jgi:hypothetical protein